MLQSDDEMLNKIDELVDVGTGIGLKVSRLDPALGDELFMHIQAWRAFAHSALGLTDTGLDSLKRHFERNGG